MKKKEVDCLDRSKCTPTEKTISEVIKEIVELSDIDINEPFFNMGIDSILAVLIKQDCKDKEIDINIIDIFDYPTVKKLAEFVDTKNSLTDTARLVKDKRFELEITDSQKKLLPENVESVLPLLPMQESIFFLNSKYRNGSLYCLKSIFQFMGNLDIEKFEKTVNIILSRHQSLRTSFNATIFDQVVQIIHSDVKFNLIVKDIGHLPENEQNLLIKKEADVEHSKGFNLEKYPLFKIIIYKKSQQQFDLLWLNHHLLADGWGLSILFGELLYTYNCLIYNNSNILLPLQNNFGDYINHLLNRDFNKAKTFWLEYLDDFAVTLLPRDYANENFSRKQEIDGCSLQLNQVLTKKIKKYCQERLVTVNTFCLAIYFLFLKHVCCQDDLTIGVVRSGRALDLLGIDKIVGCMITTNPLRVDLGNINTFDGLVHHVNTILKEQKPFEFVNISQIEEWFSESSREVVIENLFLFQNYPRVQEKVDEKYGFKFLGSKHVEFTHYPLTTICRETIEGELKFDFKYISNYFNYDTIQNWVSLIETIFTNILNNEQDLMNMEIVNPLDKKIWNEINGTETVYPKDKSVIDLFYHAVTHNSLKPAISIEGNDLSYSELNKKSNQVANFLLDSGIKQGDSVGIVASRNNLFYSAMIGILKIGAAYVPIDFECPAERVKYILEDAGCQICLIDSNYYQLAGINTLFFDIKFALEKSELYLTDDVCRPIRPENLAYVIYTSGSSGRPKGVRICHDNLTNFNSWFCHSFNVTSSSRVTQNASFCFDASIQGIFSALTTGATLFPIPEFIRRKPEQLMLWLKEEKITHFDAVPSHWSQLLNYVEKQDRVYELPDLEWIVLGGESLYYAQTYRWGKLIKSNNQIAHVYGPTEATVNATWASVDLNVENGKVPIGKPLDNYHVYVLTDHLKLCPPNVWGELFIGGTGVGLGYQDRKLTEKKFVKHPITDEKLYKTGDIGRLVKRNQDLYFEFHGRKDFQIKLNGFRIELLEIETVIKELAGIKDVNVVFSKFADTQQIICFYTSDSVSEVALHNYLMNILPVYMLPNKILKVETMMYTQSHKLDKKKMLESYNNITEEYIEPKNEVERKLVEIWSNVLHKENIGITNNLFEMGTHSIRIANLALQINKKFNIEMPLTKIYQKPTIKELAIVISKMQTFPNRNNDCIILIREGEIGGENLFFIHNGSGEVYGYIELSKQMPKPLYCWGLRSEPLSDIAPSQIDIELLAKNYLKKIKTIQPSGPYNILGWCLGGSIAFEIVRQIELFNEKVKFFGLIDCRPPLFNKIHSDNFSLKSELSLLSNYLSGDLLMKVSSVTRVVDVWSMVAQLIEEGNLNEEIVSNAIAENIEQLIFNYENMSSMEKIQYVNLVRSYYDMGSRYVPESPVQTQVHHLVATNSSYITGWTPYCSKKIATHVLSGNHYSIMEENVDETAKKLAQFLCLDV